MIVAVTRSRTVIAALCVVSVLALGACSGDDPEPRFAPPSSSAPSSPSTTAVSGPVEPTMPAAARGSDAAAAEAFVRFYWEMVNYAQATGDVEGLRSLGAEGCNACDGGVQFIRDVVKRSGEVVGGENSISHVRSAFFDDGRRITVWCDLANTKQIVDFPGKSDDEIYVAGSVKLQSVLRLDDGGWVIEFWGQDR
ncbi:hypothetical protein Noca_4054 [Nocardioides sp. JS614]|nr:hypothetical protein Noca_4054 [Nocardioides sp. JS614]